MDEKPIEGLNNESRIKKKTDSKRNAEKKARYSDRDPTLLCFERPCQHNSKAYQCLNVTTYDIRVTRRKLYKRTTKVDQDRYLSRFLATAGPSRHRRSNKEVVKPKPHSISVLYIFPASKISIGCVPVCQKFFLTAFGVKKDRVLNIAKTVAQGKVIKENRGGDRTSKKIKSAEKKQ